jgi:hypothetical protein
MRGNVTHPPELDRTLLLPANRGRDQLVVTSSTG